MPGMPRATLVLTEPDVARLLDMAAAIRIVRRSTEALARGRAAMPPKVYLPLPRQSDFRAMPAYLASPPACGVKWVNVHPHNPQHGLPTVMAVIVLNDPATGYPLAVLDGRLITKLRTAAAGAVAAQVLARPDSRTVGLIGCGAQADAQLVALARVLRYRRVQVWGSTLREAQRFCRRLRPQLPGVQLRPCATVQHAVHRADVVITLTPSRRPLVKRAWLAAGVHINAIGADARGKQELEPAILREAMVVVDDREQAVHAGELNVPVSRGQFSPRRIHATLGDILLKRAAGRRSRQALTVFDSTGLAIHDVALAAEVLRRARRRGLGLRITLLAARG